MVWLLYYACLFFRFTMLHFRPIMYPLPPDRGAVYKNRRASCPFLRSAPFPIRHGSAVFIQGKLFFIVQRCLFVRFFLRHFYLPPCITFINFSFICCAVSCVSGIIFPIRSGPLDLDFNFPSFIIKFHLFLL